MLIFFCCSDSTMKEVQWKVTERASDLNAQGKKAQIRQERRERKREKRGENKR